MPQPAVNLSLPGGEEAASALCPHFGDCGGCQTQNIPYADQLKTKEDEVRRVLAPFAPRVFHPIRPSPDIFYYRNKVEFAFGPTFLPAGKNVLGLRKKGRFNDIVNLQECRLLSPDAPNLLETVRAWAAREDLAPYNLKTHQGFLRYLVVREGKNTGQRMIHLITNAGAVPKESFLRALADAGLRTDTVLWSVNSQLSDVTRAETTEILQGPGFIEERLGNKTFRVSPSAFFQTNTRAAEVLYGVIADFLGPRVETLLDIFCGSGAIGLFCAEKAARVLGVELNARAIEDAKINAGLQGAAHATFLAQDAAQFDPDSDLGRAWQSPGTVAVVDPPRAGLGSPVRRRLCAMPLEKWIYVSCNPQALAVDLPILRDVYDIVAAAPVDLFPHTRHVETVLLLHKKQFVIPDAR